LLDADNTLWDMNAVYAAAQLALLATIERMLGRRPVEGDRLAYVRSIDQAIAERHHSRLRYPLRLLVLGLVEALSGESVGRAVAKVLTGLRSFNTPELEYAEESYRNDLAAIPALRPGVEGGLIALRAWGAGLIVVTEGGRERVLATAARLQIDGLMDKFIEGPKQPDLFNRLRQLSAVTANAFMVGDQLDRDIAPAKSAGLITIYYPSEFQPRWAPLVDNIRPDYVVHSFAEVPGIVSSHMSAPDVSRARGAN